MLKKQHRLHNQKEFAEIYKKGSTFFQSAMLIKYNENKTNIIHLAVVVSKKNVNLANQRNLLKRRVKAIFNKHKALIKKNYDIIVIIKKTALTTPFKELERQILSFLEKKRLLIKT